MPSTEAEAFTPNEKEYHDLRKVSAEYGLPRTKGTLIPRWRWNDRFIKHVRERPRKPMVVDPGLDGGGFQLDYRKLSNDQIRDALEQSEDVFEVAQRLAGVPLTPKPDPTEPVPKHLKTQPAPEFNTKGGAAREREARVAGQPSPFGGEHVAPLIKISSRRPTPSAPQVATPMQPATAVPQPANGQFTPPVVHQGVAAPQARVSAAWDPHETQPAPANPMSYQPVEPYSPTAIPVQPGQTFAMPFPSGPQGVPTQAFPGHLHPAAAVAPVQAWPLPGPPLASPRPAVEPPRQQIVLTGPWGTWAAMFHRVSVQNGFLVMVYDNRYEAGSRWAPPSLPGDQFVTIGVPSLQQQFLCSLPGLHFTDNHHDFHLGVIQRQPHPPLLT